MTKSGRGAVRIGDCEGKNVLVVGGTRGIGRAAAEALAAAGASVAVTGRTAEAAEQVAAEIGAGAIGLELDVRSPERSAEVVDQVRQRFGSLEGLVANAGIAAAFVRPELLTPAQWDDTIEVNLRGLFFAIQAAAQPMLQQESGSIVSISSIAARIATLRAAPYAASKGGLDSLTITLAGEWATRGVRVNGVAPGYVETDLTDGIRNSEGLTEEAMQRTPLRRFAAAHELGGLIAFLISDAASYITGQTYAVDGGMTAG